MKQQAQSLNTYFWNVGNDIADIRLLAEGTVALYENDAVPLHQLGMTYDEQEAASAFDTIGTTLYDLRKRIDEMQLSHLHERYSRVQTERQTNKKPITFSWKFAWQHSLLGVFSF